MIRISTMTAVMTGALLTACGQPAPAGMPDPMPTRMPTVEEANKDLLHRYHVDVWEKRNGSAAAGYLAPNFAVRSYPSSMPLGQMAGMDFFYRFISAFPDLKSKEEALLAAGDKVSIQWTMTGTHGADFFGVAATGRTFTVSGMDILRVENGKFVEQWGGFADQMDEILTQLQIPSRSDLNGVWETGCFMRSKTRLSYDDLKLRGSYFEYADDLCTNATHLTTWTAVATTGDSVAGGARKLDLSFSSFKSKPLTAANAAASNQMKACGFSDWADQVEKDVLGANCGYFSIPMGAKSLDLYLRAADTLQFGQGSKIGASLSETDRPMQIDLNRVFTKI
jgi:predicted ester cyclase